MLLPWAGLNNKNIDEIVKENLIVYPNPSKDLIKVEMNFYYEDGFTKIITVQGKTVL